MTHLFLQASSGGGASTLIFMVGFFAIFYFFMIRPQMKRAKEQKKFQSEVKTGDRIMTVGGIFGEIVEVGDTDVVIKLDQGRMRIQKAALSKDSIITEGQDKK